MNETIVSKLRSFKKELVEKGFPTGTLYSLGLINGVTYALAIAEGTRIEDVKIYEPPKEWLVNEGEENEG